MKQITLVCLVVALVGSMVGSPAWARGGGGGGGGHGGGGFGGGGHFGGGYGGGHYGGGHYGGYGGGHYGGYGGWGYGRGYYGGYYGGLGWGLFGLGLGYGLGYGWPYYGYGGYGYGYPPAVVTVPSAPPVYIEQGGGQAAPQGQNYWYYCPDSRAYYPYVKQCPSGWQPVAPQPPAPQ